MKTRSTLVESKLSVPLLLLFTIIISSSSAKAQPTNQTFTSSGTYSVPAGYFVSVTIEAWGAGGGGGTNTGNAKGGGGGGAYASRTTILGPGNYTVTVGTGGAVATAGGSSSFTTLVIAAGGSSTTTATGGAGGTTAASTGTTLFAGGNGGNGAGSTGIRGGGGGGGSATATANGGNGGNGIAGAPGTGGAGGTGVGSGGNGANDSGTPDAVNGTAAGGGGGGRGNNGNSRAGADGRVIVTVNSFTLPVRLSGITAFEKNNGIQIDWTAYSEENLSHYEIERSADGNNFSGIGTITARNSVSASTYGWLDLNPSPGVSFYRLRSVDLDSRAAYSTVVKVNRDKQVKDIFVYPNPVKDGYLSLQSAELHKGNYRATIFNNSGQEIFTAQFSHAGGTLTRAIQLPQDLKPGIYSLQLVNDISIVTGKTILVQ